MKKLKQNKISDYRFGFSEALDTAVKTNRDKIIEILEDCFEEGLLIGFETGLRPIEWKEQLTKHQKESHEWILNNDLDKIIKLLEEAKMNFIKLTVTDHNNKIFINPENIIGIMSDNINNETNIYTSHGRLDVKESPEQIIEMIRKLK